MVKYIVTAEIDVIRLKKAIASKAVNPNLLKNWDYKSPLFGTGTGCRKSLTPNIESAEFFKTESAASSYARTFLKTIWWDVGSIQFIKILHVMKVVMNPHISYTSKYFRKENG